jgi:hypothetical protein
MYGAQQFDGSQGMSAPRKKAKVWQGVEKHQQKLKTMEWTGITRKVLHSGS